MGPDTCGTCVYLFTPEVRRLQDTACRRYPPEILPLPTPQGLTVNAVYPPVRSTSTACGEHKPRLVS